MPLTEAASSGDRRSALEALRDDLAAQLDDCGSKRDYAALSQRFMDVVKQLDELDRIPRSEDDTPLSLFQRRLEQRQRGTRKRTG